MWLQALKGKNNRLQTINFLWVFNIRFHLLNFNLVEQIFAN